MMKTFLILATLLALAAGNAVPTICVNGASTAAGRFETSTASGRSTTDNGNDNDYESSTASGRSTTDNGNDNDYESSTASGRNALTLGEQMLWDAFACACDADNNQLISSTEIADQTCVDWQNMNWGQNMDIPRFEMADANNDNVLDVYESLAYIAGSQASG